MRSQIFAPVAVMALAGSMLVSAQSSPSGKCVAIGAPKPATSFTYRYSDASSSVEYTNRWEQLTPAGSRLLTTRLRPGSGQTTYVSQHQVVDDVFVLEGSTATGTDPGGPFNNSMRYSPGALGDPAFRACEGKTWTIAAVGATSKSARGSFSTRTDPGDMKIISIHESVTVPAGTFDTVHYVKTMNSGRGQVVDEIWKSIEHGVTVRRNSRQPGSIASELLIGIR